MSQFTSGFWDVYIGLVTIVSIVACAVLLWMQSTHKAGGPDAGADPVIDRVAEDGRDPQQAGHEVHVQAGFGFGAEGAGGKEQGVARKERGHHQARLGENDEKQDPVGP